VPIAPVHTINEIVKFTMANCDNYWNGRADCRQAKQWFPAPNPKTSKEIQNLTKWILVSFPAGFQVTVFWHDMRPSFIMKAPHATSAS
jgi:hypothetical protein